MRSIAIEMYVLFCDNVSEHDLNKITFTSGRTFVVIHCQVLAELKNCGGYCYPTPAKKVRM